MKLHWQQAPIRTVWGDDMVVASVSIDNDHTLSLYCERDQTPKVDAMFAQRQARSADTWIGLTDEQIRNIWSNGDCFEEIAFARAIEAAHGIKEKNSD